MARKKLPVRNPTSAPILVPGYGVLQPSRDFVDVDPNEHVVFLIETAALVTPDSDPSSVGADAGDTTTTPEA